MKNSVLASILVILSLMLSQSVSSKDQSSQKGKASSKTSSASSHDKTSVSGSESTKEKSAESSADEIGVRANSAAMKFRLKDFTGAEQLYQKVVEELKKDTNSELSLSDAYFNLALCQRNCGKDADANANEQEAKSIRSKLRVPETRANVIQELVPNAIERHQVDAMFKEVNALLDGKDPVYSDKFKEANEAAFTQIMSQSWAFREAGEPGKAIGAARAGLAMANKSEHPSRMIASALNSLAGLYRVTGRNMSAMMLYNAAIAEQEKFNKADDPLLATLLDNSALVSLELGNVEKARDLQEKALAIYRKVLPADSKDLGQTLSNIAETYEKLNMPDKAIQCLNEALVILKKSKPEDDPMVLTTMDNLAATYSRKGELEKAEAMQSTVIAGLRKHYTKNPLLAEALANYAHTLVRMKKFDKAIEYQKQSTDMFIAIFGERHPHAIRSRLSYAAVLKIAGREKEANDELAKIPKS